ncbi:glutamine-hydrolyzing carbamoyl-phosphate synthase small subunit [Candidatus Peregrinibacteria bacterium]|nr:MAG: glutamine-hydrolyzing carbamoyl-phosphate synthase small subunit [Candidatus Peregrinibacteria bacterium]
MHGQLLLSDGTQFSGTLLGAPVFSHGEVVFNTGMSGYELSLTDPSYRGQILVFTYPLIGNYGIPSEENDIHGIISHFESSNVHVRGVVVGNASEQFSHYSGKKSLSEWLLEKGIPVLSGIDTRALTQKLREHGVMLGQIVPESERPLSNIPDPNEINLVEEVSVSEVSVLEPEEFCGITIAIIDTGIKNNILRNFLQRGVRIIRCPWNVDCSALPYSLDGLFLANGPGDPEMVAHTIAPNIEWADQKGIPLFGICLGNQILALSLGAKTYKLRYGHRGVNQPCLDVSTKKAVITSQNHGFAVDDSSLPDSLEVWFTNLNDGTVEGLRHKTKPIFSVQFHPEACPGPKDTEYLFDVFLDAIRSGK